MRVRFNFVPSSNIIAVLFLYLCKYKKASKEKGKKFKKDKN